MKPLAVISHCATAPLRHCAMSTVCQQKSWVPNRHGRVVALDDFRMHRLALVISDELRRYEGSTRRSTSELDDVAMWRRPLVELAEF